MSINDAQYPTTVYDGTSPRRADRIQDKAPEYEDYDQVVAELIAAQTQIDGLLVHNAVADNSGVVLAGTCVYLKAAGTFADADTDGSAAERVGLGLLKTGGADSLPYDIALPGHKLTLTTAEWDAAGDTTGGLKAGLKYYADDTPGQITETTPPPTAGDTLLVVGIGLSTTTMLVLMQDAGLVV